MSESEYCGACDGYPCPSCARAAAKRERARCLAWVGWHDDGRSTFHEMWDGMESGKWPEGQGDDS